MFEYNIYLFIYWKREVESIARRFFFSGLCLWLKTFHLVREEIINWADTRSDDVFSEQ